MARLDGGASELKTPVTVVLRQENSCDDLHRGVNPSGDFCDIRLLSWALPVASSSPWLVWMPAMPSHS